jgi:hypothetical protein
MPKPPWKPPMWLFALDVIGLLLLGLGLAMQFAPETALSQALPAALRLPLLAVGGVLFALCWAGLAMSLLDHRRG